MQSNSPVRVWTEQIVFPTYEPHPPDKNPMFLEKRVYQGSSGRVYPLPVIDRIAEDKTERRWKAVWLENEFLRVLILPEIGGRIHAIQDKTNGYDLIYRQNVIKPALVGLAGPWISGGIEFNWPQHHRPSTFMPADVHVEESPDGSATVWLGEHDPMARMKGMHGACLHPGKAFLELKARAYNRTPFRQTFLWWANAGVHVHEGYQSFFPPDVYYVADHAKRATSRFPLCESLYYGVDYGSRGAKGVPPEEIPTRFVPPHGRPAGARPADHQEPPAYAPNDLSWYANIPVPTSYMAMGSQEDFLGGYDHFRQAGIIHIADHHIAPGKKQWTWGNHEFGYAWDRNLTDADGPYVELMAGVFTDNQPDFSFLDPGETRSWSQFWYPIQKIGPAQHATLDAALSLHIDSRKIRIGVSVSAVFPGATIRLERKDAALEWDADLAPGKPFVVEVGQAKTKWPATGVQLRVLSREGRELAAYRPQPTSEQPVPPPAVEPLPPAEMRSADELYLTGLHLDQYRHATRCPTLYWHEALRRDPLDARCNDALGLRHLKRGEFNAAERHFRNAIERLTHRNPNPEDGAPFYHLGLCLRYQLDAWDSKTTNKSTHPSRRHGKRSAEPDPREKLFSAAYDAFYKATWNHAWQSPAFHALGEMDCRRQDWAAALDHLERSLRLNTENLRARDLRAIVLRKLGESDAAEEILRETLALDPLDWWARHLLGEEIKCNLQTCFDLALDNARAGLFADAIRLLRRRLEGHSSGSLPPEDAGAAPMLYYYLGWLEEQSGDDTAALYYYRKGGKQPQDYCFPSRLEEIAVLSAAIRAHPADARAPYYLGNLLYDRRRHEEAIRLWERGAHLEPDFSVVWRNLGIGYFNIESRPAKARRAYEQALRVNPSDPRLLYERDQLWKRLGVSPRIRLRELEKHPGLVEKRDDLSLEFCALYNQTGQPATARTILENRRFQPWEGGEGLALGQHVRTHLALGRRALHEGDAATARNHFAQALTSPPNLGEAKHLLANQSDIHYWLGVAEQKLGNRRAAKAHWQTAATFRGDFQEMSVRRFSEITYFSAMAWGRLGNEPRQKRLLEQLLAYAEQLQTAEAKIDYFATSLPTMLLFEDDLQARQVTQALFLQAQAHLGLGNRSRARRLLASVLKRDPNHAAAADLS